MTINTPSPLSAIRVHRQREERRAFQAYAAALKKWERARDQADDAAWDFQLACADLQQKTLAGSPNDEIAALRRQCRKLQETSRRLQCASAEAKAQASASFTALIHARNARQGLDHADESTGATIVALGAAAISHVPAFHWN